MTVDQVLGVVAAVLGSTGTLILFYNSYALEPLEGAVWGGPLLQAHNESVRARNRARAVRQRVGLALLCAGFLVQAAAVLLVGNATDWVIPLSRARLLTLALALAAAGVGLHAAWLWRAASLVPIDPAWPRWPNGQPMMPGPEEANSGFVNALVQAASKSAALNWRAARWTAASVILTGLSAVAGAFV